MKTIGKKAFRRHEYPADVDEELIDLLDVLNSIPGVRTLYSCCGHGREEFYIACAFTSIYTQNALIEYFNPFSASGELHAEYVHELMPFEQFRIRQFGMNSDSVLPEEVIGFYNRHLGQSSEDFRRREYEKMCKYLMQFVPHDGWFSKKHVSKHKN